MAKVNLSSLPRDLGDLSDSQAIKKIASYLYILNEQLRYELTHIDEDNLTGSDTTAQGLLQAKKPEEKTSAQEIDLTGNESVKRLEGKIENLKKQLAQDEQTINRLLDEATKKVNKSTFEAYQNQQSLIISGLQELISTNTSNITTALNNAAAAQRTADRAEGKANTNAGAIRDMENMITTQTMIANTSARLGGNVVIKGYGVTWLRVEGTNGSFMVLGTEDLSA